MWNIMTFSFSIGGVQKDARQAETREAFHFSSLFLLFSQSRISMMFNGDGRSFPINKTSSSISNGLKMPKHSADR